MDDDIRWYLVYFDRWNGQSDYEEFADQDKAFAAYMLAERRPDVTGDDPQIEVVLIGAPSIEAVRLAYPHYFDSGDRETRMQRIFHQLVG